MESQPQNPEFRTNSETFTHAYIMYGSEERRGSSVEC